MQKVFVIVVYSLIAVVSHAQPYLDIASIGYTNSPDASVLPRTNTHNNFRYYNAGLNLPFIIGKDSSAVIVSPYAERWNVKIDNVFDLPAYMQSLSLQITFSKNLSKKWNIAIAVIPRWNGDRQAVFTNDFQLGGVILASYNKRPGLTLKFGLYYNGEISGSYFMPLAGIDWRINGRNNLFGILPGNLVFEHKVSNHFYYGADFNAITNTYDAGFIHATNIPKYLRISDNQLSMYGCFRVAGNVFLQAAIGNSVLRSIKLGVKDASRKYYYTNKMNDNLFFKLTLNYRIRF